MLTAIQKELEREKSFKNMQVSLPKDMAELAKVFETGGAEVKFSVEQNSDITIDAGTFFGMINVNKCRMYEYKNYGAGQTVWAKLANLTGQMLAGKNAVIAGYGATGKDIAQVAVALGARVVITETNPVKALEAILEGFDVLGMDEAARYGDIFVTATDSEKVISEQDFMAMKNGAVLYNTEISGNAIDLECLEENYIEKESSENGITEYELLNGRCLKVIASECVLLPAEMTELDYAVLLLAFKKFADKLVDDKTIGSEISFLEIPEATIAEARKEVAKRKLRMLGCRN